MKTNTTSDLLFHTSKWSEVAAELQQSHPHSTATQWVDVYAFGLRHARQMLKPKDTNERHRKTGTDCANLPQH